VHIGQFSLGLKMAPQRSTSARLTCFMCILFLMSAAAITMSAIVLNRMLKDDENSSSPETSAYGAGQKLVTSTSVPSKGPSPAPDFRTDAVVDCDPPNSKNLARVTQEQCQQKQ
jgi:hypothetical protein